MARMDDRVPLIMENEATQNPCLGPQANYHMNRILLEISWAIHFCYLQHMRISL